MKFHITLFLIFSVLTGMSQEQWTQPNPNDSTVTDSNLVKQDTIRSLQMALPGKVTIYKDPRIDQVNQLERGNVRLTKTGYRVQILLSQNKEEVNSLKAKLIKKHDEHNVYVNWQQPNFSLKIGDFYTRQQAVEFKYEVSKEFPAAIVVKDNIELPKLITNQ